MKAKPVAFPIGKAVWSAVELLKHREREKKITIEPEDMEKLFRLGESVSRVGTASEHGTGLGLLLCREFTERNGGKLWVSSVPGEGSVFSFSLPAPV